MFGNNKSSKLQNRVDTLIGEGTRIEGNIMFGGGMRIDGQVRGNVTSSSSEPSTLVIGERGRIDGEIRVSHLVVKGVVEGPLYAAEFVELEATSRVTGDVYYKTLEMHPGSVVDGKLIHRSDGVASMPTPKLLASDT